MAFTWTKTETPTNILYTLENELFKGHVITWKDIPEDFYWDLYLLGFRYDFQDKDPRAFTNLEKAMNYVENIIINTNQELHKNEYLHGPFRIINTARTIVENKPNDK